MKYTISGIGNVREDVFFISNTLFFDKYKSHIRGYRSEIHMNDDLVDRWNSVISKRDIVYHLGNFSVGDKQETSDILKVLNGRFNLIVGQEDNGNNILGLRKSIQSTNYKLEMNINDFMVSMNHYPQVTWNQEGSYKSIFIYGNDEDFESQPPSLHNKMAINVSVDNFILDRCPIEFTEIIDLMDDKIEYFKNKRKNKLNYL